MGNFLFQAACALAYAWKHKLEFSLPNSTKDPKSNPIYLQHLVNPKWNDMQPAVRIEEQSHCFQIIPFREQWRHQNIILDGYWQSEKYFCDYRERILEAFGYENEQWKGIVSLHVRRGDYLTLTKKHPSVSVEWMVRAMALFPGSHFMFFSDDMPWCKQTFQHRKDVSFSDKHNEEKDLVAMSHCEHHICSASTFSWWGAWLNRNPDKRVVFPNNWFVPGYKGLQVQDIIPERWEKLP